jgi:hypothetical protein
MCDVTLTPAQALAAYAVLFWQNGTGRFAGQTFADHEGEARSVTDTLRACERELRAAVKGDHVGVRSALRDMARLKEFLNV